MNIEELKKRIKLYDSDSTENKHLENMLLLSESNKFDNLRENMIEFSHQHRSS